MNDKIIKLKIDTLGFGGDGIGRHEGLVCFVPGALPEEIILAKIIKQKKKYLKCTLKEILTPSPLRIKPVCPLAYLPDSKNSLYCPGCIYQNIKYRNELEFKNRQLIELFSKFSGISENIIKKPLSAGEELYYRNKIVLHVDDRNSLLGYYSNDNKTILNTGHCYLANKEINEALKNVNKKNNFIHNKRITFRYTKNDGVIFFTENNENQLLTETTKHGIFKVPLASFFQVNPASHDKITNELLKILDEIEFEYLIDIYCGVGLFGIIVAKFTDKTVYATEIDKKAVEAAKINAEIHNVKNIKFIAGDAKATSGKLFNRIDNSKTAVILDPPRAGLSKDFIQILYRDKPKYIIYISCAADTLCRDINLLKNSGYIVEHSRLVDMFPRTAHFETISLLKLNIQCL
ncbi:MAG: class I SAM-dependent RNA methyltransferase [bacterium]|nr:class I SAM-dependent RNA methyltransferase [bacterium]